MYPEDKDVEKLTTITIEDIELEKKIRNIMSNSELLKGKEYIDFLLDFLQGRKDEVPPAINPKGEKSYCFHELTQEESQKLLTSLL